MRMLLGVLTCVGALGLMTPVAASGQPPGCAICEWGELQDADGLDCYSCAWGHSVGTLRCATPFCTRCVRSVDHRGHDDCSLVLGLDGRAEVAAERYVVSPYNGEPVPRGMMATNANDLDSHAMSARTVVEDVSMGTIIRHRCGGAVIATAYDPEMIAAIEARLRRLRA